MKKFVVSFLAVIFAFSFSNFSFAGVDDIYEAAVIDIKGDVKVDPNADGSWFAPWVGMKLKQGALLKTGPKSSAKIVFDAEGLNVLKIDEDSQITVKKSAIRLPGGSVIADFRNLKKGSSFTVKTPNAACAIRGSAMGVIYRLGRTIVKAFRDTVYTRGLDKAGNPTGKENEIPEGKKSELDQDGTPGKEEDLSEEDKKEYKDVEEKIPEKEEGKEEEKEELDPKDIDEQKEVSPSQ